MQIITILCLCQCYLVNLFASMKYQKCALGSEDDSDDEFISMIECVDMNEKLKNIFSKKATTTYRLECSWASIVSLAIDSSSSMVIALLSLLWHISTNVSNSYTIARKSSGGENNDWVVCVNSSLL